MNYEKKYDEALERARKLKENPQSVFNEYSPKEGDTICDYIFPELCESKDERIRKELIEFVKSRGGFKQEYIAWLEKQGEQMSDPRYCTLDKLIEADDIYQMSLNDAMVEEAKNKAIEALSKLEISKLLGLEKQGEQKPTWNEEDNTVLNNLIYALANDRIGNNRDEYIDWLKSLIPQKCLVPSEEEIEKAAQEWDTKANFSPFYMTPTGVKQDITSHEKSFKAGINWILKFLGPQKQWKPSVEQIEALESATENCAYSEYQDCLRELIGQLKKLKE